MGDEHSSRVLVAQEPHQRATRAQRTGHPCPLAGTRSYWLLLQVGFTVPSESPRTRCALTAPFHPYRPSRTGGFFSVALSCESPRLAVSQHPALWSSDFPPLTRSCGERRSSGPLRHLRHTTGVPGAPLLTPRAVQRLAQSFPVRASHRSAGQCDAPPATLAFHFMGRVAGQAGKRGVSRPRGARLGAHDESLRMAGGGRLGAFRGRALQGRGSAPTQQASPLRFAGAAPSAGS